MEGGSRVGVGLGGFFWGIWMVFGWVFLVEGVWVGRDCGVLGWDVVSWG